MKALLLLLPLLAGDAPAPSHEPFAATFARFRALVEEGRADEARALAEPLLSGGALAEGERAALAFGLGLAGARGEDPAAWQDAVQSFQSARALAGSGELRRRATYDAGVVDLQEGERQRAQIPEVAQRSGAGAPPALATPQALAPVPAPGATPAPGGGAAPEDPLPAARAAYERARATLCERLRSDWKDADTRANLELVQRRLHELDEIEKQREEQEKQREEQQQGQDQEPQDDSQGEDGDQQQKQQQADDQDQKAQDQDEEDGERKDEGQEQQQDQEQPGEPQQEEPPPPSPEDEAKEAERPDAGELQPPAQPGEEKDAAQAGEPEDAERHLTREEVLRLLDRLAELEAQGKALEARLRQARRETVEKDW